MKKILTFLISVLMVATIGVVSVGAEENLTGTAKVDNGYVVIDFEGTYAEDAVNALSYGFNTTYGQDDDAKYGYAAINVWTNNGIYGLISNMRGNYPSMPMAKVDKDTIKISIAELADCRFINGKYKMEVDYSSKDHTKSATATVATDLEITTGHVITDFYPLQPETITSSTNIATPYVGEKISDTTTIVGKTNDGKDIVLDISWKEITHTEESPDFDFYTTPIEKEFIEGKTYYFTVSTYFAYDKGNKNPIDLYLNGQKYDFARYGAGRTLYTGLDISDYFCSRLPFTPKKLDVIIKGSDGEFLETTEKIDNLFNNKHEYVVDQNKANKNEELAKVLGEGGHVEVKLVSATYDKPADNIDKDAIITTMEFDVVPQNAKGEKVNGKELVFRLPVDLDADYKYANVYHEGKWYGQYEVKTEMEKGKVVAKYIEVSSNSFSVYSYDLTNTKDEPAPTPTPTPVPSPAVKPTSGYSVPNTCVKG